MKRWFRINCVIGFIPSLFFVFILIACGGSSGGGDNGETEESLGLPPVVYTAESRTTGDLVLFASFSDGDDIVQLSASSTIDSVIDFKISPDGNFVAYRLDQSFSSRIDLFAVAVTGGTPVRVSSLVLSNTEVLDDYKWAPDSLRIAYRANRQSNRVELFTVRPAGTGNTKVSGSLPANGNVESFKWAPDSSLIAYVADRPVFDQFQLWTTRPTSVDNVPVSAPLIPSGDVFEFEWAPDAVNLRIAYSADQRFDNVIELFTAPPSGSDNKRVSGDLFPDGDVMEFAWAPNSLRIAYRADQDTDDLFELYTTLPTVATGFTKVSGSLAFLSNGVTTFKWAPDSSLIAYTADQDTKDIIELYTSPFNTSTGNVKVSGALVPSVNNRHAVDSFAWAPNSTLIAFNGNAIGSLITELFSTEPAGSDNVVKISGALVPGGNVTAFVWAPDSFRVAYRADQDTLNVIELYTSLPNTNTGNKKVSGEMQASGSVEPDYKWAGDSSGLGYVADQISDELFELFESLPDGSKNKKISGTLAVDGDVFEFDFVPD